MSKRIQIASAVVAGVATCQMAGAALTYTSGVGASAVSGAHYVTFDNMGATGGTENGLAVSFTPDGQIVTGSTSTYAAPSLSGNNNLYFGTIYTGSDTTKYVTSGGQSGNSAIFTFGGSQENYLGLLWGSVDSYNTLTFYSGGKVVGSLTGAQVIATPNGDRGTTGTTYVNIFSDTGFDKVVLTSSQYAFEVDNVAFGGSLAPTGGYVPEPATYGALAGAGLLLVAIRSQLRKQNV